MTQVYPLPTESPYTDIAQYVPLLLAAVEAELDRSDAWDDFATANGYVEDLKAWIQDFIAPMTIKTLSTQTVLDEITFGATGVYDSGLTSSPDFSSYDHLEVQVQARCSGSFTASLCYLYLNNDTTNGNYDSVRILNHTSLSGSNNASFPYIGGVPGATAPGSMFADYRIWLPFPNSNRLKVANIQATPPNTLSNAQYEAASIVWNNDNPITRIRLEVANAVNTFAAGSRFRIIGHKTESVYVAG